MKRRKTGNRIIPNTHTHTRIRMLLSFTFQIKIKFQRSYTLYLLYFMLYPKESRRRSGWNKKRSKIHDTSQIVETNNAILKIMKISPWRNAQNSLKWTTTILYEIDVLVIMCNSNSYDMTIKRKKQRYVYNIK